MGSRRQRNKRIIRLAMLFRILMISLLIGGVVLAICLMKITKDSKTQKVGGEQIEIIQQDNRNDTTVEEKNAQDEVASAHAETQAAVQQERPPENTEDAFEREGMQETDEESEEGESEEAQLEEKVIACLENLTLEQKVAQMFFVTPEQLTGVQNAVAAGDMTKTALENTTVGGIIYFASNLENPQQTKEMLYNTQTYAKQANGLPIFLATDEEGGRVLRVGSNENFAVEKVGAMGEVVKGGRQAVYDAASTIGAYLADLNFNTDFAPDTDVITNPENQVIGNRSFGTDPSLVAQMAWVYAEGLHAQNILASYKHFPGHGGTSEDSHSGYAYLNRTLEEIKANELVPFADAANHDVEFVMVSHISVPKITGGDVPASLSKELVTDLLRDELGYHGIIITDSLQMGAVSDHYSAADAAQKAILAGCDMLLMPADFQAAYQAVLQVVESGVIEEKRIDESVKRILRVKLGKLADDTF